ncbi:hypothetical protein HYC85_002537 [Camellia sinensis]|uniref:Protein kinase domain-containing protein n=1 Tax=Camellia sinensis TaxID=4442 RepID=A0A7J7IAS7_CAMSI|nr:hypothetical protein HYC85_002537 [Camellia sinensis]
MNCFYYFKDRTRIREQRSAPIFKNWSKSKSDSSAADRVSKTSCSANSPSRIPKLYEEKAQNLIAFSFSELRQATNGFNRLLKIGEGGFGSVFKGSIKAADGKGDPIVVAIKMLDRNGFQELLVVSSTFECRVISNGWQKYNFLVLWSTQISSNLLDTVLVMEKEGSNGYFYFAAVTIITVIYRDFKSSNVLLDEHFKPKLSDFGLAREGPTDGHTHVSTAVVGTFGYAAPDYIQTGHLTTKSDVWSFGVALYEILTGRRSLERNLPKTEHKLLEWIKNFPADSKKFGMVIDPRLKNQYSLNAARKIAKLADSCLLKNPKVRPMMSQMKKARSDRNFECNEDETVGSDNKPSQLGPSESVKRRLAQLAKLRERFGGVIGRRIMIVPRAKVP